MKRRHPPEFVSPLTPCNVPIQRCSVSQEQASRRILIFRLGAHGDIVMGSLLLAHLRRAWPDAHLTWVAERPSRAAIEASPHIDEVIAWDGTYWKQMLRLGLHPLWLWHALSFRRELRRRHFDIFISLQPEEWPTLVQGVGAAMSIGVFDTFRQFKGKKRTSLFRRFYTCAYTYKDLPPHRLRQYLLPLQALALPDNGDRRMCIGFTAEDAEAAQRYLSKNGVTSGEQFVILAPMATWSSRCWPEERYAALGDLLAQREGCRVVLIGSQKEKLSITKIAEQMQTTPLVAAGDLSFREIAALISRASVLISGDTGPMHVAAAVGTPFVALFGPTPSEGRAPLSGQGIVLVHPVPCGPCDQKFCANKGETYLLCQKLITVSEVYEAVSRLLCVPQIGVCS